MTINEKHPKEEVLDMSPNKKGSKGKGIMSSPKAKKKVAKSKATSSKAASKGATPRVALREGTLANPGHVLGLRASMLKNPTVAEKLLEGVIPPIDREEVGKLNLDRAISRLFYGVGQVINHL